MGCIHSKVSGAGSGLEQSVSHSRTAKEVTLLYALGREKRGKFLLKKLTDPRG